jgi:hypothetical protein
MACGCYDPDPALKAAAWADVEVEKRQEHLKRMMRQIRDFLLFWTTR